MELHSADVNSLCSLFGTDTEKGLDSATADILREKFGENRLKEIKKATFSHYLLLQFKNIFNLLLCAAAVACFAFSVTAETGYFASPAFLIFAGVSVLLGALVDSNSVKSYKYFTGFEKRTARVLRDGEEKTIPESEVVPGDVLLLSAGDAVPADARLFYAERLICGETVITGESAPSEKTVSEDENICESNTVFMGGEVLDGIGKAIVFATGMNTRLGSITEYATYEADGVAVKKRISFGGAVLAVLWVLLCIGTGFLTSGLPKAETAKYLLAVTCAVVPCPLIIGTVFTIMAGVKNMAKNKIIVRKLECTDILGRTTVLCTGKRGVLTQDRMTVKQLWSGGKLINVNAMLSESSLAMLKLAALCCNANIVYDENGERRIGSSTESAIIDAAMRNGLKKEELDKTYPRLADIPFAPARRLMTTVHMIDGEPVAVTKGAFNEVLRLCKRGLLKKAINANEIMCEETLRVIAVAYKPLDYIPTEADLAEVESDLTFIGLIGMNDPLSQEASSSLKACMESGIKPILMTGDNLYTATAVAKHMGILTRDSQAVTGADVSSSNDEELARNISGYTVFAEVNSEEKARIVKAFMAAGNTVAAVGGGTDDLAAVSQADTGFCLEGRSGEAVKSCGDVLIADGRLSTLATSFTEGRRVSQNISKLFACVVACCVSSFSCIALSFLFKSGVALPVNGFMVTSFICMLAAVLCCGAEPCEKDILKHSIHHRIVNLSAVASGIASGLFTAFSCAAAYFAGSRLFLTDLLEPSAEVGTAMAFLVLLMSYSSLALFFKNRDLILKSGVFTTSYAFLAFAVPVIITILTAVPSVSKFLGIAELSIVHRIIAVIIVFSVFIILELTKAVCLAVKFAVMRVDN